MQAVHIPEEVLHAAFRTLDAAGNGTVSLKELKVVLCKPTSVGTQWTEAEAATELAKLDTDGKGLIEYKKFAAGGRRGVLPGGSAFLAALSGGTFDSGGVAAGAGGHRATPKCVLLLRHGQGTHNAAHDYSY
eukprot:7100107-Prymnesium_polylepis.1